jgi:aerobic carbon-monoxide dehydrogenase small subunit
MTRISLTVNGSRVDAEVAPRTHLADFLRETRLLTGTHLGCEHGICGACTVEIDGEIARSCITLAVTCDGATIRTIEGFAADAEMAALREAFRRHHALQCGYCTPGMLIAARDLVRRKGGLDRAAIRREMSGNLCRCTGYMGLISAIAEVMAARTASTSPRTPVAWLGPAPGPGAGSPHSPSVAAAAAPATAATPAPASPPRPAPAFASRPVRVSLTHGQDREGRTRLSQHFVLAQPAPAVWALVADIERLARCMPGLSLDGPPDGERVAGHLDLKLGPITARFAGEGRVQLSPAEQRLSVEGRGIDRKGGSNVAGSLVCRLEPAAGADGPATAVRLDLSYALTGPLAQIGRGVLARDLARQLGELFAANMARQLTDPAATIPASPLAGWAILRQIVRARVARWLARLRRRP